MVVVSVESDSTRSWPAFVEPMLRHAKPPAQFWIAAFRRPNTANANADSAGGSDRPAAAGGKHPRL